MTAADAPRRGPRHRLKDTPLRVRMIIAATVAVCVALGGVLAVGLYEVRHELRGNVDSQLQRAGKAAAAQVQVSLRPDSGINIIPAPAGEISPYIQTLLSTGEASSPQAGQIALPVDARDIAIAKAGAGYRMRDVTVVDGQNHVHLRLLTLGVAGRFAGTNVDVAVEVGDSADRRRPRGPPSGRGLSVLRADRAWPGGGHGLPAGRRCAAARTTIDKSG